MNTTSPTYKPNTLIVVVGPTAIGKTSFAISLALHFNSPIISADARQFYREMNIGTARPTYREEAMVKHHFTAFRSAKDPITAADFTDLALNQLEELFQKNSIAIMVGGSGLYIDAICRGFDDVPETKPEVRNRVNELYEERGLEFLQSELKKADPGYFEIVDQNNPQRLSRALEVYYQEGVPFSSYLSGEPVERPFNIVKVGLEMERDELYSRINQRVDRMIAGGLLEEAKLLHEQNIPVVQNTIGYKELFAYFDGEVSKEEAIENLKRNTRRLAKRQLTWFKRDKTVHWFEPIQATNIINFIDLQVTQFTA